MSAFFSDFVVVVLFFSGCKKEKAIRTTMEGFVGGWVTESAWTFMSRAGRCSLSVGERSGERGSGCQVGSGLGRDSGGLFFYHFFDYVF